MIGGGDEGELMAISSSISSLCCNGQCVMQRRCTLSCNEGERMAISSSITSICCNGQCVMQRRCVHREMRRHKQMMHMRPVCSLVLSPELCTWEHHQAKHLSEAQNPALHKWPSSTSF